MFGSQWVASQLNMSAVTALPPISHVRPMIMEIGTVYSSTMKSPYMKALKRPSAGLCDCFMKKETVIGTIGKTHGVSSMAKPQRIASIISAHRLSPPLAVADAGCSNASLRSAPPFASLTVPPLTVPRVAWFSLPGIGLPLLRVTENSQCSGAAQNWSLQPLQVNSPFTVASSPTNLTFWENTAVSKKTSSP